MKPISVGLVCLAMGGAGLFGCGGGDEKKDVTPFLGTWNLSQGIVAAMCGTAPQNSSLTGSLQVSAGTSSDLVASFTDPALAACMLRLNVKNGTATALAGQTCTFTVQSFSGTFTVSTGTLAANGTTGNLNVNGSVVAMFGSLPVTCSATVMSALSRSTGDAGATDAM